MFVTEEEHLPLGGRVGWALGFAMPVLLAAIAGTYLFIQMLGVVLSLDEVKPLFWLLMGGTAFCAGFTFCWHGSAAIRSILASVFFAITLTLFLFVIGPDGEAIGGNITLALFGFFIAVFARTFIHQGLRQKAGRVGTLWSDYFLSFMSLSLHLILFSIMSAIVFFVLVLGQVENALTPEVMDRFDEESVLAVFQGGLYGFFILLARSQRVLVGATRYGLMYISRFMLPFCLVVIGALYAASFQSGESGFGEALLITSVVTLSVLLLLIYNVGENPPPVFWVRASFWLGMCVLAGLTYLLVNGGRVSEAEFVDAIYAETTTGSDLDRWIVPSLFLIVLAAGAVSLFTEFRRRPEKWLPPFGPVLMGGVAVWLVGVVALQAILA